MNSSSNKFILSELRFEVVAERLKSALELKTSNALAAALGMSSSAYANRKQAGSLPFDAIIKLALARDLSLHWVFTGQGEVFVDGERGSRITPVAAIDSELFGLIFHRLWAGYLQVQGNPENLIAQPSISSQDQHDRFRELIEAIKKRLDADRHLAIECALLAASAYNKVASIESKALREATARSEVDETLGVIKLRKALQDNSAPDDSVQRPLPSSEEGTRGGRVEEDNSTGRRKLATRGQKSK